MADDTQKAKEPVAEPQVEPMPSSDEKTAAVEEKPQAGEELPEDAKERTKRVVEDALSKAKTYEQQLRDERAKREYYENLFQSMQPQEQQKFIDPLTGLPDEKALANLSKQAEEALRIAQEAKQKNLELQRDQENKTVYAVHPDLNPEDKSFNKDLHTLTRSFLLDSMLNPDDYGGKELSFIDAVAKAKEKMGIDVEKVKKEAAQEAIEQLTPKEQASLEAVGSPSRRNEVESLDDLKLASRGGDESARLARIKRFERIINQE